jgi:hypothetical protein
MLVANGIKISVKSPVIIELFKNKHTIPPTPVITRLEIGLDEIVYHG